jgi:two-component system cell cycle response regulator
MVDGLRESYLLDAVSVVLLDPQHEVRHLFIAGGDRPEEFKQIFFVDSLIGLAPQLAVLNKPWLGPFVGADHHLLFPDTSNLKSAALVPLPRKDRATGALCFGSRDPTRFTRHHGTDFLAHLGAVAAVCIENAVNRARLLRAGITDFLTGWHNRRYLQERLKEDLARAQRRGGTIACLMIDIDRFKSINDGYGHLAGDNALKEIAQRVETQIRSMDTAARFGGDELAILLPDASAAEAAKLGERIREVIAALPFALTSQIERSLTVSVGVAAIDCWPTPMPRSIGPRHWGGIAYKWVRGRRGNKPLISDGYDLRAIARRPAKMLKKRCTWLYIQVYCCTGFMTSSLDAIP